MLELLMGAIQPDDGDVAAVRTIARESSREPTQEDGEAIFICWRLIIDGDVAVSKYQVD